MKHKIPLSLLALLTTVLLLFSSCAPLSDLPDRQDPFESESFESESLTQQIQESAPDGLPVYTGAPYVEQNQNVPHFTADQLTNISYERYSELDALGRCGIAMACVGIDLMPTEDRDEIGSVKPSGWQSVKYDIVSGKYLYNRCHLIGFQLSGENANEKNLITGTRYLNVDGMLPFENMIADYVKETENHVLLRVTPIFYQNELVARGVQMEALSIEDDGYGICFNVYVFNVQPGIVIDYQTGESRLATDPPPTDEDTTANTSGDSNASTYVINQSTGKFHLESCSYAQNIKEENKEIFIGDRNELVEERHLEPCSRCNP